MNCKPGLKRLFWLNCLWIAVLGLSACSSPSAYDLTRTVEAPTLRAQETVMAVTRVAIQSTQTAFAPTAVSLNSLCSKTGDVKLDNQASNANNKYYLFNLGPELDFKKVTTGFGIEPRLEAKDTLVDLPSAESLDAATVLVCLQYKIVIVELCNYRSSSGGATWSVARYRQDLKVALIDTDTKNLLAKTVIAGGPPRTLCPKTMSQVQLVGQQADIGGLPPTAAQVHKYLSQVFD